MCDGSEKPELHGQGGLKSQGDSGEWEGQGESMSDRRPAWTEIRSPRETWMKQKWRVRRSISFSFVNQDRQLILGTDHPHTRNVC